MPINIAPKLRSAKFVSIAAILLLASNTSALGETNETEPITVFVAASLADVMPRLADAWQTDSRAARVRISVGASGVIARQIEAGANTDLFISANQRWINYLIGDGHAARDSTVVAGNRLVMVIPCGATAPTGLDNPLGFKRVLTSGRFAMADPKVSPAGDYTKTALEDLALWGAVKQNATYAGSVRLALLLTERGGLPGFVYATDARKSAHACIAVELPTDSYPAIEYVGIVPKNDSGDANTTAAAFLTWLTGPVAAAIWQKHGFAATVPK